MKRFFIIAALVAPSVLFAQKETATLKIKGQLKNVKDTIDMVFLNYSKDGKRITDSSSVVKGEYAFSISIKEPIRAQLFSRNSANTKAKFLPKMAAIIYLEPGNIKVQNVDSFSNIVVKGSKAQAEYEKLTAALKPFNNQMEALYKVFTQQNKSGDIVAAKKTEDALDALEEKQREEVYGKYINSNPTSPIGLYVLQQYAGYDINADKVEPLFNQLSAATQASAAGTDFKAKIDLAKKTGIGKYAMEFTQNDTLGNPVSLASFKGKYVLIDFWASWCGPCRRENPNVVKTFNAYKHKPFTILSVSLDQPNAKDKWIKAIHDDNLTWTHVSDLQFWNNAVAKQYGIQAIPQNLLLDPDGKIIAKNLHGQTLSEKLSEVFK
ncbi:MAG: TlpA disulfide reductase family protein [Flavobacterium sp.]|nr:TlpA disulfide reductase family protein [Flavobacterium sp.]